MKVTNKHNLPQPFVDLVSFDDYSGHDSDYTTTSLLRPPRIAELSRRNWDKMEEDASDLVWRMSGQTKHVVLERIAKQDPLRYTAEKRLYMLFMVDGVTFKISGQIDLHDSTDQVLYDWKETSIWKVLMGDQKEWEAQANINTYLARANSYFILKLENIAFLKDWKMRDSEQKPDYPPSAIQSCPLPMWHESRTKAFIEGRIRLHEAAKIELPLCTDEERWAKPEKFALMKKGQKRAVRLYETEAEAQQVIEDTLLDANKLRVEHRPGESTRCKFFCGCLPFCQQGQELIQEEV